MEKSPPPPSPPSNGSISPLWLAYIEPDASPMGEFVMLNDVRVKTFMAHPSSGLYQKPRSHGHPQCYLCKKKPIIGERYACLRCYEYMLCPACEAKDPATFHPPDHMFAKFSPPRQ